MLKFIVKCIEALQNICQNGTIHCDTKPDNVMIVSCSTVKFADFGLSYSILRRKGDKDCDISKKHKRKCAKTGKETTSENDFYQTVDSNDGQFRGLTKHFSVNAHNRMILFC